MIVINFTKSLHLYQIKTTVDKFDAQLFKYSFHTLANALISLINTYLEIDG